MSKKVAILCSGLDNVLRGYETHCRTLFDCLKEENIPNTEFLLFKRQGIPQKYEIVLSVPYRSDFLCQFLAKYRGDLLYWEYLFFALRFISYCIIRRKKFETIVVIEPMASKTIYKFRKLLPGKPKIVFTHGVWNHPSDNINNADVFHEVSVENYVAMKTYVEKNNLNKKVVLLPHFLKNELAREFDKAAIKNEYSIKTKKVLLSVGAINRGHKRMHYVINEALKLSDDWTLVLCGVASGKDADDMLIVAKEKLGERFVHIVVAREEVPRIYAMADVFVLASTQEGFGIVILEAMQAGLPIVLHDRELFKWILKQDDCCINMEVEGNLETFLKLNANNDEWLMKKAELNRKLFAENYSWKGLRQDYLNLLLN